MVWVRAQGNTEIDGVHILYNSFTNIGGFGITSKTQSADLQIIGNRFDNIGEDTPARLTTAIQLTGGISAVKSNGKVSRNTINTTTFAGINFGSIKNFLIDENTISNVAANGIQIANSPDAEGTIVRNNEVTNADNKSYTFELDSNNKEINPQDDLAREAGITIWANSNNITVTGNTVTGSHDGIIVCNNTCGVSVNAPGDVNAGGNTIDSRLEDDVVVTRNKVTGNTGADSDGYEIANFAASGVLNAQKNYYGGASPGAAGLVYGSVYYQPWYSDAALATEQWNPEIKVTPATFDEFFDTDSNSGDYGKPLNGKITHGDTVKSAGGDRDLHYPDSPGWLA